jgi:hypothetical protein
VTEQKRKPIPDVLDDAVERDRRAQLFEAADVAYRCAQATTDSSLDAWDNALADGISS